MIEGHLSPAQAAEKTGFPLSVIYAACASKKLDHVRFSERGSIHIAVSALEAWAEKHRIAAKDTPATARTTRAAVSVPARVTAPSVRDLLPAGYEPQFQVSR